MVKMVDRGRLWMVKMVKMVDRGRLWMVKMVTGRNGG